MKPFGAPRPRKPRRRSSKPTKSQLQADIEKGKYILNPEFNESEDTKDQVASIIAATACRFGGAREEYQNYFPEDFAKAMPEDGAWIAVAHPPVTEYTVPPMSIWFATPWPCDCGDICGVRPKRVKIITPKGSLGIWPREYFIVKDIKEYVGREADGVYFRQLSGEAIFPTEELFYLQSRGIRRTDACMMLLDRMKGQTFGWFEIAPPYGAYFGEDWPEPDASPFATPADQWIEDKVAA